MRLGKIVFNYREENEITQAIFAKRTGLARSYIARLERGDYDNNSISFGSLIRIAKVLGMPLYELINKLTLKS